MNKQSRNRPQRMTLKEIAQLLNCPFEGKADTEISGFNSLEEAEEGDIVFLSHPKYRNLLEKSKASAAIIPHDEKYDRIPVLKSENPHLTFVRAVELFYKPHLPQLEIHPTALISPTAKIGKNVAIGAFCHIGEEVEIGSGTLIFPLVAIYPRVKIGECTVIHSSVSLREGIQIGNNVIIHNAVVIGSDGFGYLRNKEDTPVKIPQAGTVIIEDKVEIGANTVIDRAALGETIIREGTKIDNLVQIAHNVEIGANSLLAGQAGIAGSTKLGKKVIMGGQAGVSDHINIGDNVHMAAKAGVMRDIPANSVVAGAPQMSIKEFLKTRASFARIPELIKTVKKLEAKIRELEKKINKE